MKYFLLTFFAATHLLTFAQDFIKQSVNIKQDGYSYKFYILDADEKGVRHYDNQKQYYWFKAQKVMSTQGGSSGNLLDGTFQSFYSNNQLSDQGEFEKGLKTGEWKKWDTKGTLIQIENWKNGNLLGKQSNFDGNGKLTSTTTIKRRITIIEKVDTTIVIKGKHVKTVYRDSLGNTKAISRTKKGLLHGNQETADNEGKLQKVKYKNGTVCQKKENDKTAEPTDQNGEKTPLMKHIFKKKDNKTDGGSTKEPKEKKKLFKLKKKEK